GRRSCPRSSPRCWPSRALLSTRTTTSSKSNGTESVCSPSAMPAAIAWSTVTAPNARPSTRNWPAWRSCPRARSWMGKWSCCARASRTSDCGFLWSRDRPCQPLKPHLLARSLPAPYVAFDLLYHRSRPLLDEPLRQRRAQLGDVVGALGRPQVVFSEGIVGAGREFFRQV